MIFLKNTFSSERSGEPDTMSVPQEQEKYTSFFFQDNFQALFRSFEFYGFCFRNKHFFSFQGLESISQEAILASEAGKQEKRKQKGNVRNKMSRKKNSCMLL